MYRIRTAAGSEATYNSLEEFTAAVRRGAVVPEDEIFHSRANRWLDVKSHPHYRTAIDGGHAPAAVASHAPAATPAPVTHTQHRPAMSSTPAAPAPAPRPVQAPAPAQAPVQSRAQVFERPSTPTPKPSQQTQVHPQFQAAPRPESVAPPSFTPPVKSKELTFVDTGVAPTVGHPRSPAVEVAPAPPRTELKPAARPAPIAKATGSEMDFLIMDGGIESPVRTSAGHKTIPEEFGLLFDATAVESQAPAAPAPGKSSAVGARSGKQQAIVIPADAPAPVAPVAAAPSVHAEPLQHDAPVAAPAPAAPQSPSSWATGSRSNYLGGGIALVVIAVGLLAWKPWKGGADNQGGMSPVSAQIAAPSYDPTPSSLITPVSATIPPTGSLTGAGAVAPLAAKPGVSPTAKPVDTAVTDSARPEVVVAARPDFGGGGIPVSGDISLGTEVAARGTTSSIAPSEMVRRMQAAQKDAQLDLNGRLVTIGFRGVINPARLSTPALVAAARTAWTGGVDAIRTYRARIARIEKAYEDSVLTSQRAQRWPADEMRAWTTRQSLSEPSDASQLSDLMFTQVGEALEILGSMPGEYTVTGDKISFRDAGGATRYTSIRGWVEQRMATWSSTPESARPYSVSATLRALGDGFPAVQ